KIWALDRGLAITSASTMDDLVDSALGLARLTSSLLGAFALLALALMAVGVYGLMAFTTAERLPEIGVRVALGADRGRIVRMVVGQGVGLALAGVALGVGCAVGLSRVVEKGGFFGVPVVDPITWVTVAATLVVSVVGACWWPARRASRVDPVSVLRSI